MSEYFTFDGVDCRDFSVHVFDLDTFGGSARSYDGLEIPGKSGNVLIDNKRYPNRSHTYSCIIYEDCERNLDEFRNFLLSRTGYCRLEDSIHPDEFYQACVLDDFDVVLDRERHMCKMQVTFNRKPQRFLKAGEIPITYTATGTIMNPSRFPSQPLIRVTGTGNVGIGHYTVTVSTNPSYIDIDSEVMEAFNGNTSHNSHVSFVPNDFPVIESGVRTITLGAGITQVVITPRWYKM